MLKNKIVYAFSIFVVIIFNRNGFAQSSRVVSDWEWNNSGTLAAQTYHTGAVEVVSSDLSTVVYAFPEYGELGASIAWHPIQSNILAIGTYSQGVKLIDVTSGTVIHSFDIGFIVYSVSFSSDGTKLVLGMSGPESGSQTLGYVGVIDINTGTQWMNFQPVAGRVTKAEWQPQGNLIAGASSNGVILWDTDSREIIQVISDNIEGEDEFGHYTEELVQNFAWHPNGDQLAILSHYTLKLMNMSDLSVFEFSEPLTYHDLIEWKGNTIVTGSKNDFIVSFFDTSTLNHLTTIENNSRITDIAFLPDSQHITIIGNSVDIWDIGSLPHALVGNAQIVTADAIGTAVVTLDGADSVGAIVDYVWTDYSEQVAIGEMAQVVLPIGTHVILLSVTDIQGLTSIDYTTIIVIEPVN